MSQNEILLAALQRGEKLTPLDALHKYQCLSLSQRCGELRREGHPIRSEMVKVGDKRVARYSMGDVCSK